MFISSKNSAPFNFTSEIVNNKSLDVLYKWEESPGEGSAGSNLFRSQLAKAKWLQSNWQLPRHGQGGLGFNLTHWQQNSGIVRSFKKKPQIDEWQDLL